MNIALQAINAVPLFHHLRRLVAAPSAAAGVERRAGTLRKTENVKKLRLQEGDVFAVTLKDGGYALGVLARRSVGGEILLGYFFGPRLQRSPIAPIASLRPQDAIAVLRFGYLHLRDGTWPVLARVEPWLRKEWPSPFFVREDPILGKTWLVTYSDDDPAIEIGQEPCGRELLHSHGRAVLSGAVAVELKLTKLLEESP